MAAPAAYPASTRSSPWVISDAYASRRGAPALGSIGTQIETVSIRIDQIGNRAVRLVTQWCDEPGPECDEPGDFAVELIRRTGEVEMRSAGTMNTTLQPDAAYAVGIAQHQPSVTVLALRLVQIQHGAPKGSENSRLRRVERHKVERRTHPVVSDDAPAIARTTCSKTSAPAVMSEGDVYSAML